MTDQRVRERIDEIYRSDSRRVLATLIRLLGDFDLAEEASHDAFTAALESWTRDGVPANPRAWLVSTGRFKAIDRLRRGARFDAAVDEIARSIEAAVPPDVDDEGAGSRMTGYGSSSPAAIRRSRRRAHRAHPPRVCGSKRNRSRTRSDVAADARSASCAQDQDPRRRDSFQVPREDLSSRLDAVLHVVYLVFNEGYSASAGDTLTRPDLSGEAIRLGRLLVELLPEPEAIGLLALMLLHDARRAARTSADGELVLLDAQDRTLWNRAQISEGLALVERALSSRRAGPYSLQAAIAALHAEARDAATTDWPQIVGLYDVLLRLDPSPVVELNRAAAIAMRDGPAAGLALIDSILVRGDLADYHLAFSAKADLCRRLARTADAVAAYERALALTTQLPERRFIERRLAELRSRA
jgi:RNA polymerase sigma-70 factor (ECF subfamily)